MEYETKVSRMDVLSTRIRKVYWVIYFSKHLFVKQLTFREKSYLIKIQKTRFKYGKFTYHIVGKIFKYVMGYQIGSCIFNNNIYFDIYKFIK